MKKKGNELISHDFSKAFFNIYNRKTQQRVN